MTNHLAAMWVMYDMCQRRTDRRGAFTRLRGLGLSRRDAAELIHEHEREG